MSVSRSPAPSSIDLSGVPARVAEAVAQVVAVCHEQFRSDPCPEAFEEAELRVRETMNALACELLGAVIEKRDDGASRIERDGQSWFRVAATPRTIMTSLGPLTYRRARYRSGASGSSPVPVDESLGLVDDYLTRPAAQLGLLMMGHCTAREAAAFFAKIGGMTPSVSTLQRLTRTMQERWETPSAPRRWTASVTPRAYRTRRSAPRCRSTASWCRCGPARMAVPRPPGARPPAARFPSTTCRGERLKTLYLGRMPESGKVTLKAQLASEVAHIRQLQPRRQDRRYRRRRRRQLDLGLETLSPETEVIDFWHACEHLRTASDHAVASDWFERYREVLRHDPCGVDKVIRALRHLRDSAKPDRAEIERELAFAPQAPPAHALPRPEGRGRRHRLRRGRGGQQDPGDPAHEALRHALADRRRTGCADLPRPDQIRSLRPGMEGHHRRNRHTGQRQHQSLCRHRHRCLNSMNEAPAINAIRDSHPSYASNLLFGPLCGIMPLIFWVYDRDPV